MEIPSSFLKILTIVLGLLVMTTILSAGELELKPVIVDDGVEWSDNYYDLIKADLEKNGYTLTNGATDNLELAIKSRGEEYLISLACSLSGMNRQDYISCEASAESLERFISSSLITEPLIAFSAVLEQYGVLELEMVGVPGGSFTAVGDAYDHKRNVNIENFRLARTELTWKQWNTVYSWAINNGYHFKNRGQMGSKSDGKYMDENHPVTVVSWRDAMVWCNAATEYVNMLTGGSLKTVYNRNGYPIRDSRDDNASVCDGVEPDPNADGYRLPSMDEWEYAARYIDGASWTPYNYASGADWSYKNESATKGVAWYYDNSVQRSHPVAEKRPNALGIYDMSGNVWEFCFDWHPTVEVVKEKQYKSSFSADRSIFSDRNSKPDNPYEDKRRVLRGGGWSDGGNLQVGYVSSNSPGRRSDSGGFRPACSPSCFP